MLLALCDTETTHLNPYPEVDAEGKPIDKGIIEYAVRLVDTSSGILVPVDEYTCLQDPGFPIPPEATAKNHITDAMVKGHELDQERWFAILGQADFIVTHHVQFDRGWLERDLHPAFESHDSPVKWACSYSQIDWSRLPSRHLVYLAWEHEIEIDRKQRHRAMYDVHLLHSLLDEKNPSGIPYWQELINNASQPYSIVFANNSAFETKELLKADGYSWGVARKAWWKLIHDTDMEATKQFLMANVYGERKFGGTCLRQIDPLVPRFREKYNLV